MKLKALTLSTLLTLSYSAMADVAPQPNDMSGFYASIGVVNFDAESSYKASIDDSATYFKLGWEQHSDEWIFGAGISSYLYSDNGGFSQATTDGNKSSGASAINGYLEGGYKYTVNENVSLSIIGGLEQVFSSTREIDLCSNCYSEDIDIEAGVYIQPRMTYLWDNGWYASAAYTSYLADDVESALFLTVGVFY